MNKTMPLTVYLVAMVALAVAMGYTTGRSATAVPVWLLVIWIIAGLVVAFIERWILKDRPASLRAVCFFSLVGIVATVTSMLTKR